MISDCTVVLTACSTTVAFMIPIRLAGEARNLFSVPRSISSIIVMPAHMLLDMAFIAIRPGTR